MEPDLAPRTESHGPRPPPLPDREPRGSGSGSHAGRWIGVCLLLACFALGIFLVVRGIAMEALEDAPVSERGGSGLRLRALPDQRRDVVREREGIFWTDGADVRYEIVAHAGKRGILLRTEHGPLEVDETYFALHEAGPPASLAVLLALAHDAGLDEAGLRAEADALTGPRLRAGHALVLLDGVLRPSEDVGRSAADRHKAARRRMVEAVSAFLGKLAEAPLDPATREAVREILAGLPNRNGSDYWGSLQPEFTRRLVRHGWLDLLGVPGEAAATLRTAVEEACRPVATRSHEGAGIRLTAYEDAFGRGLEVLETPAWTRFTCPQPTPQWLSGVEGLVAVVELAAGADPFASEIEPQAAEIFSGETSLGSWLRGAAMTARARVWHGRVRAEIRADENAVEGTFPPHILIGNAYGDVYSLVTPFGILRPARNGSRAETQRFLDEAVIALPDAPHLDLIGELLYTYAWDTNAYDRPLLVGTQTHNGDIHQTASQTLATCVGGCYRGDCDDLACFFHTLARHQGRGAHVLKLPWHLACAWAEQRPDGSWTAFVLHTGPPLQFFGDDLESVLRAMYASFESQESIDFQSLPFALRFGDDAVRETYYLPGEIFADRVYAQGLIAVQAAYRDHTYLSGVDTMRGVLEMRARPSGADHREIAHLLTWAGQHEGATASFEAALEEATEAEAKVEAGLDLLVHRARRGDTERIGPLADDLVRRWIPKLESVRDHPVVGPWLRVAAVLLGTEPHRVRGLRLLASQARQRAADSLKRLRSIVGHDRFDPQWLHYNGLPLHETNANRYVRAAIEALAITKDEVGAEARRLRDTLDADVRAWFVDIAFRSIHAHESRLARHGLLAAWYATRMDEDALTTAIEAAGPATAGDVRLLVPAALGAAPDARTLRLMHTCPDVRRAAWWRRLAQPDDDHDAAATARDIRTELRALEEAAKAGAAHWSHPTARLTATLALALVERDAAGFRLALGDIAARRDHDLQDTVAALMALASRRFDVAVFETWLGWWADALDHVPHYYRIAWSAMAAERPEHALVAAALAVARHPERASFRSEREHLLRLIAK